MHFGKDVSFGSWSKIVRRFKEVPTVIWNLWTSSTTQVRLLGLACHQLVHQAQCLVLRVDRDLQAPREVIRHRKVWLHLNREDQWHPLWVAWPRHLHQTPVRRLRNMECSLHNRHSIQPAPLHRNMECNPRHRPNMRLVHLRHSMECNPRRLSSRRLGHLRHNMECNLRSSITWRCLRLILLRLPFRRSLDRHKDNLEDLHEPDHPAAPLEATQCPLLRVELLLNMGRLLNAALCLHPHLLRQVGRRKLRSNECNTGCLTTYLH